MIYDESLAAACYLIGCQQTGEAILIDPERDIDRYLSIAKSSGLRVTAVTETHIHADFLSGTREVAEKTRAMLYLSDEGGSDWKYEWLNQRKDGGSYSHILLKHGSIFSIGNIEFKVIHTPGHTPEHISFVITDKGSGATEPIGIATGDFLFVGDLGRPDLLETAAGKKGAADEAARALFQSVSLLKDLPEFLQVWPAHGAGSACGKALGAVPTSTIGYEKRFNSAVNSAVSEKTFVDFILSGQPEPPLYFARMKKENKSGPAILEALPEPALITVEEIKKLNTKSVALIDTRPWPAYRKGHIPGSFFHPLNKSFVTDMGSFLDKDAEIYLICKESDIENAVRCLIRVGLDNIKGWAPPEIIDEYAVKEKLSETKEENTLKIKERINARSVYILDVRRSSEYAEGHIDNATNIVHTRLASKLKELPTDSPLVVHCQGGGRSAYACSLLQRAGFDVINLEGGMSAWNQ
jgi:hydroxyacylglutathione hydrolase